MKVILFGATGMVGRGVLLECLDDPRVDSVLIVGRRSANVTHRKLRELLPSDFFDFAPIGEQFAGADACFFCLGVSSFGMNEANYRRMTYDITLAAANALVRGSPQATFVYVSGVGTDSTERGSTMWARVKGRTENALLALPFKAAFMFRPGYIQPLRGTKSNTRLYQAIYAVVAPLYPLLRKYAPTQATTTVNVGRAMIEVAANGFPRSILTSADINSLAEGAAV